MSTTTNTKQMDTLHSEIIIKKEQNEFKSDAEEEECFYKEAHITCGNNMKLLSMKNAKSCNDQNILNDIKNECCNESVHVTSISEMKNVSCTHVVKEEFQKEEECKKNHNIKYEINDGLHSVLIIKEEEFGSNNGMSNDNLCSSLEDKTTDNLTGDQSDPCIYFARKASTKVISRCNESDTNESVNDLDKKNKKVKKKMCNNIHNKEDLERKLLKYSNQRGHTKNMKWSFKCDKCERTFRRKRSLRRHNFIHTGERPFKCDKCEKTYLSKSALVRHTLIHTRKRPFKCDKCESSFISRARLQNHGMNHTPIKCDKCKKTFSTRKNLMYHTFIHTEQNPFKCDKCEKTFARKHHLIQHTRTHTGEKPFKCDKCDKSFSTKQQLERHTFTHSGERPFKCDKCDKSFILGYLLKNHAMIHTENVPFKCDKCKKTLSSNQALIRHTLTHTRVKLFKCDKCVKSFTRGDLLEKHALIHTTFKCDKCKKTLSSKQSLIRHSFNHTRELKNNS